MFNFSFERVVRENHDKLFEGCGFLRFENCVGQFLPAIGGQTA